MKKDRKSLEEYLELSTQKVIDDREQKLFNFLWEKYDYPKEISADYYSRRRSFSEATEFELFMLLDGLRSLEERSRVGIYFTDQEINTYSEAKFKTKKKAKFPLRFNMMQVADDQWIGRTTAKQLMSLRDAQITSYNENIQRTLQRTIRGGKEQFVIAINKRAVEEIREAMESGRYISNTITLNIPDNENSDFYYNPDSYELVIRAADSLDIIDGYHRFVAIANATDLDRKFDYPMELRITNYPEGKGQRFIYQEDQKTKMIKRDSDSYNVDDPAVQVAEKLNGDPTCHLQGEINRGSGLISLPVFASIIKRVYFYNVPKKEIRKINLSATKNLKTTLNLLVESDDKYLSRYNWIKMMVIVIATKLYCDKGKDFGGFTENVDRTITEIRNGAIDKKKTQRKIVTGHIINEVEEILERGW